VAEDRASQLINGPLCRALLAALVGFDSLDWEQGIDLSAKVGQALPYIADLEACEEPLELLSALMWNPLGFGFSPDQAEAEAHLKAGAASLLKVARAVVSCPAANWWWDPMVRSEQRWLSCKHTAQSLPRGQTEEAIERYVLGEIAEQVDERKIKFYRDSLLGQNSSGAWWSGPHFAGDVYTSRSGPDGLPCVQLATMEDSLGPETFQVWAMDISRSATVYEVAAPEDWARLVDMAPLEVTVGEWRSKRSRDPRCSPAGMRGQLCG
jgi:hypothetical protein